MKMERLRSYAIPIERFLRNYCYLMTDVDFLQLEVNMDEFLDMYQIIDNKLFDYISNLSIKNMKEELKKIGIKLRGASFDLISDEDILIGDVVVVKDKNNNVFAFDFGREYSSEKVLRRMKNDKY